MDLINAIEAWRTGHTDPDTGKPVSLLRVFSESFFANDVDEVSKTELYVGESTSGGQWRIKQVIGDKDLTIRYATLVNNPSKTTYALAWTDRLALTYDRIENI